MSDSNFINLSWKDNSSNELEFDIYRKNHNGSAGTWSNSWGQLIGRATTNVTSFTDATVIPSSDYDYVVVAVNPSGNGASLPLADVKTPSAGPNPDPVASASQDSSNTTPNAIGLTWTAVDSPYDVTVAGYDIFRRPDGTGPFVLITPQPVNATSYIDSNLGHGKYDYQITAVSIENSQSTMMASPLVASTLAVINSPAPLIPAPP